MSNSMTRKNRGREALRLAGLALIAGIRLLGAGGAWASPASVPDQQRGEPPCPGEISGYLGIGLGDCRGCVLTIAQDAKSWKKDWSFATEPRIAEIAPDSPASGVLRVDDLIVGIDGTLITSAEAGRRFANIEPNRDITIRYRRGGQIADAVVRAGRRCGPSVEGMRVKGPFAQIPDASLLDDVLSRLPAGVRVQLSQSPGIRIEGDAAGKGATIGVRAGGLEITVPPKDPLTGRREPLLLASGGRLGLRLSCDSCSATTKDRRLVWRFTRPPRTTGVEAGGPADLAGVRIGDTLAAVNGHRIESTEGAEAFSDVRPGQPMQLTLRAPDGRERTVTIVPQARKQEDAPE